MLIAARPDLGHGGALPWFGSPLYLFLAVAALITVAANVIAIWRVRIWNPSRELQLRPAENEDVFQRTVRQASQARTVRARPSSVHAAPGKTRDVWDNPILWREIRTWAYGRKVLAIRVAYLAAGRALGRWRCGRRSPAAAISRWRSRRWSCLSLMLVNALAVTSITTERDLGALDLLLVTDVTPRRIHLRQARRHFLCRQGDGHVAAGALPLSVAGRGA